MTVVVAVMTWKRIEGGVEYMLDVDAHYEVEDPDQAEERGVETALAKSPPGFQRGMTSVMVVDERRVLAASSIKVLGTAIEPIGAMTLLDLVHEEDQVRVTDELMAKGGL